MGIATSKLSALSIFTPLIFETQLMNEALFLKTNFFHLTHYHLQY